MTPTTLVPMSNTVRIVDYIAAAAQPLLRQVGMLGQEHDMPVYAVGGCVRDWLWGMPVADVDIMAEGDAVTLARQFATSTGGHVTTHEQFKTATVELPSGAPLQRIDFATCRQETYREPAAYPKVRSGSLEEDLQRRDFTINAMTVRIDPAQFGQLIDLFHGHDDLRARLIRVLHARSFHDDPSRILRAVRFATRLNCRIEEQTAEWMRAAIHSGALEQLNRGRLRKELLAMLDEPQPMTHVRALSQWLVDALVK